MLHVNMLHCRLYSLLYTFYIQRERKFVTERTTDGRSTYGTEQRTDTERTEYGTGTGRRRSTCTVYVTYGTVRTTTEYTHWPIGNELHQNSKGKLKKPIGEIGKTIGDN